MTLSNGLGLALMAAILGTGISLYMHFRRKFRAMNGFHGIVTQRSDGDYRETPDRETELKRLKELAK